MELVIVSDVSSPYMDGYSPNKQKLPEGIGRWTFAKLRRNTLIGQLAITLLLIIAFLTNNHYLIGGMLVVWGMVTLATIALHLMNKKILKLVSQTIVGKNASFIQHLTFADIESMLMNRATSILKLSSSVFMKRIRKMTYSTLYDDEDWQNRKITNTIYELRDGEKWEAKSRNGTLLDFLKPSKAIQENNMGTTLWFTQSDKEKGIPEAILAAGQYTIYFNLLDYIDTIQKDMVCLNENHQLIMDCKQQLQDMWTKFQEDPLWMVSICKPNNSVTQ